MKKKYKGQLMVAFAAASALALGAQAFNPSEAEANATITAAAAATTIANSADSRRDANAQRHFERKMAITDERARAKDAVEHGIDWTMAKHLDACRKNIGYQFSEDTAVREEAADKIQECMYDTREKAQYEGFSVSQVVNQEGAYQYEAEYIFSCRAEQGYSTDSSIDLKPAEFNALKDCVYEKGWDDTKGMLKAFAAVAGLGIAVGVGVAVKRRFDEHKRNNRYRYG